MPPYLPSYIRACIHTYLHNQTGSLESGESTSVGQEDAPSSLVEAAEHLVDKARPRLLAGRGKVEENAHRKVSFDMFSPLYIYAVRMQVCVYSESMQEHLTTTSSCLRCIQMYAYMHPCMCVYVCVYAVYVCFYVCMLCMCVRMYACVCVCVCIYIYIYIYIHIYICIDIYICVK